MKRTLLALLVGLSLLLSLAACGSERASAQEVCGTWTCWPCPSTGTLTA